MTQRLIRGEKVITGTGGPIDVADVTYLVAFMFAGGPAPPPCP